MVEGVAKLAIDLGNSSTRVLTKFDVKGKGNPKAKITELSNRFYEISDDVVQQYVANPSYTEENSHIFRHHGVNICNGDLCIKEFGSQSRRPFAGQKKWKDYPTPMSIKNAFLSGYEAIAEFANVDLDSVKVSWDVVLLLPPEDVEMGSKPLAELVRGLEEIDFIMPELKRDLVINSVTVYPEGLAAFIALAYEKVGTLRPSHKYLVDDSSYTLIVDIGAGTTDFFLINGSTPILSTRFTKAIGGNNVHSIVRRLLKQRGINVSDIDVRKGVETGFVKFGAKTVNILSEIEQAKMEVSKQLIDAWQEFFECTMIEITKINNIAFCGGGSEESEVAGIEPISNYILNLIKEVSPEVSLVAMPVTKASYIKEFLGSEDDSVTISHRLLNIVGAGILAG